MRLLCVMTLIALASCQKSETISEFTGNQSTYGLVQASQYAVSGTVMFKERKDGGTTVQVQLTGTDGTAQLPVHLHMGDVSVNGAVVAALLSPVNAKTGISQTVITHLADETKVSYKDLMKLAAYLNVHASDSGPESNVILAAGNIGANGTRLSANLQVGVCQTNKP